MRSELETPDYRASERDSTTVGAGLTITQEQAYLEEDHPDTWKYDLSTQYGDFDRWAEALLLSKQLVQLCKDKLGEGHPDTLMSTRLLHLLVEETQKSTCENETPCPVSTVETLPTLKSIRS